MLYAQWYATIDRSRRAWAQTLAADALGIVFPQDDEEYRVNRRRALVDLLEVNLLLTGHASVLREAVDGLAGNDPP